MKACVQHAALIGARPGELSEAEARALALHLDGCPACRALAADLAVSDGLLAEALLARAARRDFAPFVDQVMARVGARPERRGVPGWARARRRLLLAALVPALAAAAAFMYVRSGEDEAPEQFAALELVSDAGVTTVLQTQDGPVLLLQPDDDESGT